jgi:hypothetical protein
MASSLHSFKVLRVSLRINTEFMKLNFFIIKIPFMILLSLVFNMNSFGFTTDLGYENYEISDMLFSKNQSESIINREITNESIISDTLSQSNQKDESDLILNSVIDGSEKILQVSFNGSEGTDGTLRIFNTTKSLVKEANFELIKFPFYASVDISSLASGTYKVELTTKKGIHTSSLIVK